MCDTFVALPDATRDGSILFAKNSDRPSGEVQAVVSLPGRAYPRGATLQCTTLTIPQVPRTLGVVLSKPAWMWGAEMGANERGVAIGNEAVWTTEPYCSEGLLGMDLVRLGLERGRTAREALAVVTDLLDRYGQGGNCAEHLVLNYHNSFLLADPTEAWVLETAGRYWVAERVTSGTRAISNNLSIRDRGDLRHPETIAAAIARGRCDRPDRFDFARTFAEFAVEDDPSPLTREGRVRQLCRDRAGSFDLAAACDILRDHRGGICMHGGFETRGSQVSRLAPDGCEHWFVDGPFPCQQPYRRYEIPAVVEIARATGDRR